jgi:hypothetical protein
LFAAAWDPLPETIRWIFESQSIDDASRTPSMLWLRSLIEAFQLELSSRAPTDAPEKLFATFADLLDQSASLSCKTLIREGQDERYVDATASFLDHLLRTCSGLLNDSALSVC